MRLGQEAADERKGAAEVEELAFQPVVQPVEDDGEGGAADVAVAQGGGAADDEDRIHPVDVLDRVAHRVGGGGGVVELRPRRQFDRDDDAAFILGREERTRDLEHGEDRNDHHGDGDDQGDVIGGQRDAGMRLPAPDLGGGFHHPHVAAHEDPVLVALVMAHRVFRPHEIGGHHRGDQAGDQEREEHGDGDGQAELPKILTGDAGHERHGDEDRDDGEGGGDDGEADLVRRLDRGAVGGFPHADVSRDVLDFHDGVVDQDAGGQREGQEADEVQREAELRHDPEGRDGGKRQGDGRDQRGAPVAQEGQHHEDGEQRTFQQGVDGGLVVAIGVEDGIVDQGDGDVRMLRAQLVDDLVGDFGDRDFGGPLGAEDEEGNGRLAVDAGEAFQLFIAVDHLAKIGQLDEAARG